MRNKELILRCRAASYLNTSIVVMSNKEYQTYLTNLINFHYPNLRNPEKFLDFGIKSSIIEQIRGLYKWLTFQDLNVPDTVDLYEWWLTTPVGPQSCSRDIGDARQMFVVGKGDEWSDDLALEVLKYQIQNSAYILPTGYICAETLRRKRMVV